MSEAGMDPGQWLTEYGELLYRRALFRTRNSHSAEDLVQETLLAAFEGMDRFRRDSSVKTWLLGILSHKIADHFRKLSRERPLEEDAMELAYVADSGGDGAQNSVFSSPPPYWNRNPQDDMERTAFHKKAVECVSRLKKKAYEAFTLREFDGLSTEEICNVLRITPTNLRVMLHRAREQLCRCLEINWFKDEGTRP